MPTTFYCARCRQDKPLKTEGGTGYGEYNGQKHCYDCCAEFDKETMTSEGKITLYLTCEPSHFMKREHGRKTEGKVSNWPGTLSFRAYTTVGKHNIAGTRYDVWFTDHTGAKWYGVTYGENTQICHCRRLKSK